MLPRLFCFPSIVEASPTGTGFSVRADYLEKMLKYLKNHYITEEDFAAETANHPDDIANAPDRDETEVESEPQEQPVSAS